MSWNSLPFAHYVGCITELDLMGFAWCLTQNNGQGLGLAIVHKFIVFSSHETLQ
jgi:hypothetical protein